MINIYIIDWKLWIWIWIPYIIQCSKAKCHPNMEDFWICHIPSTALSIHQMRIVEEMLFCHWWMSCKVLGADAFRSNIPWPRNELPKNRTWMGNEPSTNKNIRDGDHCFLLSILRLEIEGNTSMTRTRKNTPHDYFCWKGWSCRMGSINLTPPKVVGKVQWSNIF